ncbi:MAG: hypothetical protein OES46_05315 [Gammaproteobacteria bacterium]|nr:hypothetical protein [Gammaproteobacteria bacterium]
MSTFRRVFEIGLPFVAVAAILGAVLFIRDHLTLQVAIVGLGMLALEVGTWKLRQQVLTNKRKDLALRAEGDAFLRQLRELHAAAMAMKQNDSAEHHRAFEHARDAMRQSFERIIAMAGKTDAELAAAQDLSGEPQRIA